MTLLRISVYDESYNAFGESHPDCKISIESNLTDCTIHEWFEIFEKVLRLQQFSEYVIMKGLCEKAFNESRTIENMKKLYKEYDLSEFHEDGKLADQE